MFWMDKKTLCSVEMAPMQGKKDVIITTTGIIKMWKFYFIKVGEMPYV